MPPWELPEPQLPVALEAASPTDEDRLDEALARVAVEDPSVRVERDAETGQLLLWCLGEAHAEVLLDRLGVPVTRPEVRVALRETLAGPVTATGRLVKQSGGHGQYAVVVLEVEPLPAGEGVRFESRVVGGAVPDDVRRQRGEGRARAGGARRAPTAGRWSTCAVVLVDGKAHSVDSSDAAFTAAGALALREAAAAAGHRRPRTGQRAGGAGAVVGASARCCPTSPGAAARVTGSTAAGESTLVSAEVPDAELLRYAVQLRSLSHGTGTCRRRPLRWEAAPGARALTTAPR